MGPANIIPKLGILARSNPLRNEELVAWRQHRRLQEGICIGQHHPLQSIKNYFGAMSAEAA